MHPKDGAADPAARRRRDGALVIDLGGTPAERLDRLVVDWPAQTLRAATLIDTPGIASITGGELAGGPWRSSTRTTTRPPRPTPSST